MFVVAWMSPASGILQERSVLLFVMEQDSLSGKRICVYTAEKCVCVCVCVCACACVCVCVCVCECVRARTRFALVSVTGSRISEYFL